MKNIFYTFMCLLFLISCKILSDKNNNIENSTINYRIAKNYFVKNNQNVNVITEKIITSKEESDKIFGIAAYMKKNGKPTEIDFSKNNVIAIINPITNYKTKIIAEKLYWDNNKVNLRYKIVENEKMTFDIKPSLILIIEKNINEIIFKKV